MPYKKLVLLSTVNAIQRSEWSVVCHLASQCLRNESTKETNYATYSSSRLYSSIFERLFIFPEAPDPVLQPFSYHPSFPIPSQLK